MSSIGNSGAKSCGPMGCPVPGWSGGGSGVLRSAWMLYHLVGSSFSESRYFVVMSAGFRAIADLLVLCGTRLVVRRAPQITLKERQPVARLGWRGWSPAFA